MTLCNLIMLLPESHDNYFFFQVILVKANCTNKLISLTAVIKNTCKNVLQKSWTWCKVTVIPYCSCFMLNASSIFRPGLLLCRSVVVGLFCVDSESNYGVSFLYIPLVYQSFLIFFSLMIFV